MTLLFYNFVVVMAVANNCDKPLMIELRFFHYYYYSGMCIYIP